eukprot:m.313561 g.313561  ORF g.313561 m.313561 type:complete len:182 (-) comp16491_c3_seq2:1166-1711(-)
MLATEEHVADEFKQDGEDASKQDGEKTEKTDTKKRKRKTKIKQTLDIELLLNEEHGIHAMAKKFPRIKFDQGPGKEKQSLRLLIEHYAQWTHGMFGKRTFQEMVDKLEDLGSKRSIQAFMSSMRASYEARMDVEDQEKQQEKEQQVEQDQEEQAQEKETEQPQQQQQDDEQDEHSDVPDLI